MLTYNLDARDGESKYYFLYKRIKTDIMTGVLPFREKLPSKRSLAEHLGVSLITVETAYQMLREEGYIESRERSGYYVCELPIGQPAGEEHRTLQMLSEREPAMSGPASSEQTTDREQRSAGASKPQWFSGGNERSFFPVSLYFKTVRSVITEYKETLLRRSPNEGCEILRNSIAAYLLRYRGVFAQPAQIIIGSGAEYLYGAVVRLFGRDKVYGLEDPSYSQIKRVYEGTGAECELLPMGEDGIRSDALRNARANVLHVTPFHSYPSGVTASIGKRYEYLRWASEKPERYIVEDDFDSEFFMPGKPIETLFMLGQGRSVVYINTFSKSLSPSIRMGYMILPEELLERYRETNGDFSCTVPVLEQYVLAEFINRGYFEQHLNRVRRHKREELVE